MVSVPLRSGDSAIGALGVVYGDIGTSRQDNMLLVVHCNDGVDRGFERAGVGHLHKAAGFDDARRTALARPHVLEHLFRDL